MATKNEALAAAEAILAAQKEINNRKENYSNEKGRVDGLNKALRKYVQSQFEDKSELTPGTVIHLSDEYALQWVIEPAVGVVLLQSKKLGLPPANIGEADEYLTRAQRNAVDYLDAIKEASKTTSAIETYKETIDSNMEIVNEYIGEKGEKRVGWFMLLSEHVGLSLAGSQIAVFETFDRSLKVEITVK